MKLRELLVSIISSYDRTLGPAQSAVQLLGSASKHLVEYVPVTHLTRGSTGVGGLPFVPWIAILDPDETTSAQRGIYVVYLIAADKSKLYLSLNHGTDDLKNNPRGAMPIIKQLRSEARAIRENMDLAGQAELQSDIDLRAPRSAQRPRNYEAANIIAVSYDASALPSDTQLHDDLRRFLHLYDHALDVRDLIKITKPGVIAPRRPSGDTATRGGFKPTDGSDYYVKIRERDERRSRKHVPLLSSFADHLKKTGYEPSNEHIHPRDLVATKDGRHWLIEVKVVRQGNGQQASREAVAQLLEYRRFYYPEPDQPSIRMLAVFSEHIGTAFVEHLETLGIASIWARGTRWIGSPTANTAGLCSRSDDF